MRAIILFLIPYSLFLTTTFAQHNIPEANHFWRKRITQRIDLTIPVNNYLRTPNYNYNGTTYDEVEGLVPSLLNGLRKGKYCAYHPETEATMDFNQVYNRINALEIEWTKGQVDLQAVAKKQDQDAGINEWTEMEPPEEITATLSQPVPTTQAEENSFLGNVYKKTNKKERFFPYIKNIDFEPYLVEVQYVEDWIFDKMSSKMIYDIQYIKVIRYNTRDKSKSDVLALFKYDEVAEHLQTTLCQLSSKSDETHSMREIFEARAFKFYLTNVSGKTFTTEDEAENKLQELIEFESYLWTNEGDKIK